MKIKSIGLPLLICGAMILFLLYVPEKISGIYDEATIGKTMVSKMEEEASGNLAVTDRLQLIRDYGKNVNILYIMEDYTGIKQGMSELMSAYLTENLRQPSREVMTSIQEELDKLRQLSLLPELSVEDMDIDGIEVERYMDIRDENKYLALENIGFRKEGEKVWVRYDIENKKILTCNYSGDTMITENEDNFLVQKGWSEYLGISLEEVEKYYYCGWYKDVGRQVYEVTMSLLL